MDYGNTKCTQGLKEAIFLLILAVAPAAELADDVASLLNRHAGFSDDQIAAVSRGDRIVRMFETESQAEVAFVGVTRLRISLATYLERVRSGTLYRNADVILQGGRFSEIPSMADLKSLRFEAFDLRPLDTSAAAAEAAAQVNKQWLIASIREYEKNGTLGIGTLGEPPKPVDLAKQFEPLVKQSGYLRERLPAAYEYLLRYPHVPSRGLDDFFVWKQIIFGFRPITRVAQVSVWEHTRHGRREAIVLMKQIYANRYFQVSFQIDHIVSDDSDPMNPAVYLVSINQGRSQFLEGLPGKFIRPVVLSRTQTATEKTLDQARRDFQIEFRRTH
jgi:hypothetical protein